MKKQVVINAVSPVKGSQSAGRKKTISLVPNSKVPQKKAEEKRNSQSTKIKDPDDNPNKGNRPMFGSHRKRKTMLDNMKEKEDNITMEDTWKVLREISDLFSQVLL